MSTFLLVGASFSKVREYLQEHGHEYVTLRDKARAKHPDKKFKRQVLCDFSSLETMLRTAAEAHSKFRFDGVLATYENYVLPTAQIAKHLGLPGLPIESAEACTDKFLMRERFATAPQPISPDFAVVTSEDDVVNFAKSHDFPLILKPANLAKSLLVTKNHDLDELLENYQKTMENIDRVYQKYSPNREPKLLVEEFLHGSIHSVDAFVDATGKPHVLREVVDYQTGYDIGFDDNFHYSRLLPSKLPPETIEAIRRAAEIGCQALGMKSSPAHVEIILTPKGPRIVEIGARNGGYRERMHKLANGIDIVGNALYLMTGHMPDIHATRNEPCAVVELFPKHSGIFREITHEDELRSLPSLVYFDIKASPGQHVGKSSEGYKMCAVIMLHNKDPEQFDKDLNFVNRHVYAVTD